MRFWLFLLRTREIRSAKKVQTTEQSNFRKGLPSGETVLPQSWAIRELEGSYEHTLAVALIIITWVIRGAEIELDEGYSIMTCHTQGTLLSLSPLLPILIRTCYI
ncbi:hypothetical protein NTE_00322 [Candidatus Nitrososphaera evergladensis SR1]|uniref:Uncharacterized protein n=1 Tax=Candidatus Nitrososphaera evergladensis SR1 TaxID=1459636 RepID=A0A075MSS7_9ARCH|nr:hypothetical protein NTE_00322 [Candidatus Nitrososphaera evergladensis SR1]